MTSSEIYNGHVQCLNAFASLLQALKHQSPDLSKQITIGDIQEELVKYNVWAANTGAVNGSDSWALSLDCRLHEASSLRSQVIRLLHSLAKSVQHAAALLHGTRKPFEQIARRDDVPGLEPGDESTDSDSPWEISDDEEMENNSGGITDRPSSAQISRIPDPSTEALRLVDSLNEMTQLLGSIKHTVICLYRMPLRKPAPIDRIKGYDGTDMSLYQHFDVLYIRDKFRDADEPLATRLGKLITRRRQLLEYRRLHNEKLIAPQQSHTSPRQPQPPSLPTEPGPEGADAPPGAVEGTAGQYLGVGLGEGVTVRTRATVLRADQLPPRGHTSLSLYAPSIAESRMSAVSSFTEDQKLQIPPRPQGPDGQVLDLFECPYCGTLQNIPITAPRAWEKHVLRDLQPYVCTFEPCDMSSHFFSTKDEWFDHELTVHRTLWSCNTCPGATVDGDGGDQHLTFNNQVDFFEHMDQVHHLPTSRLALGRAMEAFRRPVPVRDGQCSLCNAHATKLKSHLARHLEQIALFALPRPAPTTESSSSQKVLADFDGRGSGDTRGTNSRASSLGTFHSGPGDNMGSDNFSAFGEQPVPDNQNGDGDGGEAAVAGDSVCMDQRASPEPPVLAGGSPGGARSSPRDEYALFVQGLAKQALKDPLNTIQGANKVFLLDATPPIVHNMVALLRISLEKALAGLEIASQEFRGREGEAIGILPGQHFRAGIEYCTDLGRSAFIESEKIMNWICDTANSYIMDSGSISFVIELLQQPHDAEGDLMAAVEDIGESAQLCLEKTKELCDKFEFWYVVISHLTRTAMQSRGALEGAFAKEVLDRERVIGEIDSLSVDEAMAGQAVEQREKELQETRKELERASADVNRLMEQKDLETKEEYEARQTKMAELDPRLKRCMEEIKAVREDRVKTAKDQKSRLIAKIDPTYRNLETKEYEARQTKMAELDLQLKRYMEEIKAAREDRVKMAKDRKSRLIAEIEQMDRHLSIIQATREAAEVRLARLGKEERELRTASDTPYALTHHLANLKHCVIRLIEFFNIILVELSTGVEEDVGRFLASIKRRARFNAKGELKSMAFGRIAEKRCLRTAFGFQARFTAIRDMSGTFVKVSNKYIEPRIAKIEAMAFVPGAEWEARKKELAAWWESSATEIGVLAAKAHADMLPNIRERVLYLQEHAVEVAFPR